MAYCKRCNRHFPHYGALEQHKQDSPKHYVCDDCNIDFTAWNGLKQHYIQSRRHHYCQNCNLLFGTIRSLRQHYNQSHHYCSPCTTLFTSRNALINHDKQVHNYCPECDRFFQTASGLASHRASVHKPPRNLKCPGRKCGGAFASISALIMHAESNSCVSGITRKAVNTFVARLDRQNIITNPARMITGPGGYPFPPAEPVYWATELSWNGRAYECFLCNGTFRTLQGLDSHLKSPRHLERIYHCPNSRCNKEYRALSAPSQHVERGSCGARRIRQIQDVMDTLNSRIRTITL
ncbi:hypothetical protein M0805_008560 [Coniferiporia weirii]|nr:hypothetical protein M0805_008560 [Coniferiporia weirii]